MGHEYNKKRIDALRKRELAMRDLSLNVARRGQQIEIHVSRARHGRDSWLTLTEAEARALADGLLRELGPLRPPVVLDPKAAHPYQYDGGPAGRCVTCGGRVADERHNPLRWDPQGGASLFFDALKG